jgi:undecaprenyl-phosphate 4-deoxy-4-formamido-L-arabinose transferase
METIKISIVIPVYNSEECLLELNKQLTNAFLSFPSYELILVNDRSADNSWGKIIEICECNKNAVGISLRKNSGQDNAIMAGLKIAKGEYIVIMDDDLQHSPNDILKLYNECVKGYDLCYGLFNKKKQKLWKNMGSWLNGKLSEKLLSKPKEIYLSPFKIFRNEIAQEIIQYSGPYPYIDALLLTITHNISQIELEHHNRYKGNSNFNLLKSISVFIKHATGYSIYPLRLAIYLGFLSAFSSFVFAIYFLIDYFMHENKVEGWISTILLILFFSGVILISLGIIGEYVGRIFLTINKKPQYTIEKMTTKSINNNHFVK